jgi:hypothetical protein
MVSLHGNGGFAPFLLPFLAGSLKKKPFRKNRNRFLFSPRRPESSVPAWGIPYSRKDAFLAKMTNKT